MAKYVAGREKDREYVRGAVRHGLVRQEMLMARIDALSITDEHKARLRGLVGQDFTQSYPSVEE